RLLVVTPDMHRVHHSILRRETDSNFGFNLPWWDRVFGTYRAAPEAGHAGMTVGLPIFRNPRELRMDRLLTQPFRDGATVAALGGWSRAASGRFSDGGVVMGAAERRRACRGKRDGGRLTRPLPAWYGCGRSRPFQWGTLRGVTSPAADASSETRGVGVASKARRRDVRKEP